MRWLFLFLKIAILATAVIVLAQVIDFKNLELKNTSFFSSKEQVTEQPVVRNQERSRSQIFSGSADDIIALVNQARQAEGKQPLVTNSFLARSAMLKAQDMKDKSYFDHVNPEGLQPWFFVEKAGYRYKTVGENLAEGYFSAQEVHDAWMQSEGHRQNVLSGDFDEIGVAVLEFEQNGVRSYLAVQHFGSPLKDEDLVVKTKCDAKVRTYCEDAQKRINEVESTINKQKKIIKQAKKEGADKKDLKEAEENLEKLEDIKTDLQQYVAKCTEFIENCDVWE